MENNNFEVDINGVKLRFKTSKDVFSPKSIDMGTRAMLSLVNFTPEDKVLDLGCGYGVVGILAAKLIGEENVVMSDADEEAVNLSRENCILNDVPNVCIHKSDGFKDINEKDFTLILSNPPYHADFSVPKEFIEKGFNRLALGGKMFMVTKRKDWYKNKLISVFGGVKIEEIDGYYVFMSVKKNNEYANHLHKLITKAPGVSICKKDRKKEKKRVREGRSRKKGRK